MLPAHFHNVVKNTSGPQIEPNNAKNKHVYYTCITQKNLSYSHDLLTAELRDYADLIKFLNMSKT